MKAALRKIVAPLLRYFESGTGEYQYKSSHRTILVIVGCLFLTLSVGSIAIASFTGELGAMIPFLVFFSVSFVCLVVGLLGSDHAVAKIWGNR